MNVDLFVYLVGLVILLLLSVFMLITTSMMFRHINKPQREAKKHICSECLLCKNGNRCVYFLEENIDANRAACKHFEKREYYEPA